MTPHLDLTPRLRVLRPLLAAILVAVLTTLRVVPAGALITLLVVPAAAAVPAGFVSQPIASGLRTPVDLAFLPDGRILFVEFKSARLRMLVGGSLAATDPLGTVDSVATSGGEQGLLSLAVDPRWPASPFVYVLSTAFDNTLRVSRLTLTGDLANGSSGVLAVVAGSRRELLRDIQTINPNHNGGTLRFGPDSLLYASFGEDANYCNATDTTALYGVVARMEVRTLPAGPGPPDKALLVPASNPYADRPDPDTRLMYARGFRNPFRFSIDAPTGRVFVADVANQGSEEIDVIDAPGLHFGWPFYEGTAPWAVGPCLPPAQPMVPPIAEYARGVACGTPIPPQCAVSIIGGVVIRHVPASLVSFPPEYDGQYLYLDFYAGRLWRLRDSLGTWVPPTAAPGQPNASDWGTGFTFVSSLVLGKDGAVYYAQLGADWVGGNGVIGRIIHMNPLADAPQAPGAAVELTAVYPSPTRGATTLRYMLSAPARVRLTLYDAQGRLVRRLVPETSHDAGEHRAHWDGADASGRPAAPGIYLARIEVDGVARERRVALVR